jgi:flagellar hook-associated protein 1 FlgK
MGNLFSSVLNSANALSVYDRQLAAIQNNIANASTPGYARQTQTLEAMRFDLRSGLPGGVSAGPVLSARSSYAEQSIRNQSSRLGYADQKAADLARIEPLFDPTSNFGVAGAITEFFKSFSQLSVNPNDRVARQAVIDQARNLTGAFNQVAAGLGNAGVEADRQIRDTVSEINRLGAQIREINTSYRLNAQSTTDAGLDAKMYATLEELSQLTDFSLIQSADGTMSVYIGGQTPLVVGDHQFELSADFSSRETALIDSTGADITGQIGSGKLKALLEEKNKLIPGYLSDLDTLAISFADQVNAQLAAGLDANGAAPTVDLFEYNAAQGAAMSMGVTAITPDEIAAATPEAPGGNGNALNVAAMLDTKTISGYTFTEYFGKLGGNVGRDLSTAQQDRDTQRSLVTQAHAFRDEVSGVSLNEEAAHLLQVQRAYQAAAKLMTVLNEITDTLIQALR